MLTTEDDYAGERCTKQSDVWGGVGGGVAVTKALGAFLHLAHPQKMSRH